ncbi:MAG TPA: extracellular solute-binding protein [Nitrososphaeraceae archaeon]|nr:extracellular solute-binding protein [Nitrososphaeraceae archaeon]
MIRPALISITALAIIILSNYSSSFGSTSSQQQTIDNSSNKENITLTAILEDQGDPSRWHSLIGPALDKLRERHPNTIINIEYATFPYNETRGRLYSTLSQHIPIDLITLDQIWLGEFANHGLIADLANYTDAWGRQKDWYEVNWDGGAIGGKIYGIWAWTDVRGIWYWKDLLKEASVDPNSLKTWDGYIAAAKQLNSVLRPKGIEGIHLTGAGHSPDLWYPYLWMLGGNILQEREGHPTKGTYWFPAFNSSEGVRAMQFIKDQIDAGIKPQRNHFWGEEFLDRKFAVMIEALQHHIPITTPENRSAFEEKVGFIPMFPVPHEGNQTSTLMGGWLFSIPSSSNHKDLAWELITIMLEPDILGPYLVKHANLPTQIPIGEGPYSEKPRSVIPYYNDLISMINFGHERPNIREYPQIAGFVKEALDSVFYMGADPKEALDEAASKSAKVLGWH